MSRNAVVALGRDVLRASKRRTLSSKWVRGWLHDFGIRPVGHSTLLWVREDDTFHTRVTMRNYFSLNYGIPTPEYSFTLHDADGSRIAAWTRVARPDETLIVDSKQLVRHYGLGRFEGTLVVEVQDRKLDPPRFLRANVDYYSDEGMITTVHDQGRLVQSPRADVQSLVYVRHDADFETGVVLQNWYRFRRSPREYLAEAEIELLNHTGERLTAPTPKIPACASRFVSLSELFPDAVGFLSGQPGGMRIRSNITMGRSIPVVRARKTGFAAVSHTVGDHDPLIYERDLIKVVSPQSSDATWAPVWCSFVEESEHSETQYSIFNNWLPRGTYSVDLRVFDGTGTLRCLAPSAIQLGPDQTHVLRMRDVLASAGIPLPFSGMVEARLTPKTDQEWMPAPGMFQINTVWSFGGVLTQSNNQSLGHANSPHALSHYLSPKRTKMFGRVISNDSYETLLSLMNPSSDETYGTASNTEIVVCDASGTRRIAATLLVPPHGSLWISLDKLFPRLAEFLQESEGVSTVLVVDRTVKLTGYLGVRDRRTGNTGIDHLFGG